MITAIPETTTAWPEVAAALGTFLTFAAQVEERIVDADRHTDQQDHAVDRVDRGHQLGRRGR